MTRDLHQVDTVIIGAGAIGLAIARELANNNASPSLYVLEQHARSGEEVSSHNSGVIHAGIYYPTHSLKARLCVQGNRLLYRYAALNRLPFKQLGKLIVAKASQRKELEALFQQGLNNGVQGLTWLEQDALQALEPNVTANIAIQSSTTGIIDAPAFVQQLEFDASAQGAHILFRHQVVRIKAIHNGYELYINHEFYLHCRCLINAAGLSAGKFSSEQNSYFAQGQYFTYQAPSPFSQLIYPLPEKNQQGLGVHSTIDMHEQLHFGPDVQYMPTVDYHFDENRKHHFAQAIRQYFPALDVDKLKPGQVGVRPKISAENQPAKDFHISKTSNGRGALITLMGIESPGLTASLAIGQYVRELLNE